MNARRRRKRQERVTTHRSLRELTQRHNTRTSYDELEDSLMNIKRKVR